MEFLFFVACCISGWTLWYRDYRIRTDALIKKHITPKFEVVYAPGVFPWELRKRRGGGSYELSTQTQFGMNYAIRRHARQLEKAERLKKTGFW